MLFVVVVVVLLKIYASLVIKINKETKNVLTEKDIFIWFAFKYFKYTVFVIDSFSAFNSINLN